MFKQQMRRSLTSIIGVLFLVMSLAGTALAETENEAFKAIVEEIFATYSAANMNGDADLYISLWDENGIQMGPNKPAVFGKSTIGEGKRKMLQNTEYESQIIKVEEVQVAVEAGILPDQIIIDPGIGFGKKVAHNLEIIRRLREFTSLGKPILIGTSRKAFIGKTLGFPVDDRVEGTAATVAIAINNGADIVRVHDVKEMSRVAKMTDAIVRSGAQGADA